MKKFYFSLLLLSQIPVFGQTISFQDQIFKEVLLSASPTNGIAKNAMNQSIKIDANDDGEIQVSEALEVSKLWFTQGNFNSTNELNYFSNLNHLQIQNLPNLTQLDVSQLQQLKHLQLTNTHLNHINTSGITQLETFILIGNRGSIQNLQFLQNQSLKKIEIKENTGFGNVSFSNYPALENLSIYTNPNDLTSTLTAIDLTQNTALKEVEIENSKLQSLQLSTHPQLNNFVLKKTLISQLDFTNAPQLRVLNLNYNQSLQQLNIQNNAALTHLKLEGSPLITQIDIRNKPQLTSLYLTRTALSTIDLEGTTNLTMLSTSLNQLTEIDVTAQHNLLQFTSTDQLVGSLDFSQNHNLQTLSLVLNNVDYLNLKNGTNTTFNPHIVQDPNRPLYICADDNRVEVLSQLMTSNNYRNTQINSYCSFRPGGTSFTISGVASFEQNTNNCTAASSPVPLQRYIVTKDQTNYSHIGSLDSTYELATTAGNTQVSPFLEHPNYFTVTPNQFAINFPNTTQEVTQNFCITPNGTHADLEIIGYPTTAALPGEIVKYQFIYKNKGNTTQTGTIQLQFDPAIIQFTSATPSPNSSNTGVINWTFGNLEPLQQGIIEMLVRLNRPTDTPALNGDDVLTYTLQINGATDETPADNNFVLNQTVVNSFDPNDKICLEGEAISPEKVGEYVHYRIRFENTGTANARNIVVRDDIDLNKFDINTLIPISSSHDFKTRIEQNKVEFIFENIQLPFDDENNDGYVVFKIKTKPNLQLNDTFSNTAKIYFDYNHPIITNTYTTAVHNLGINESNLTKEAISIYPNPVKDKVNFQSKEAILKAEIYDINGRLIVVSPAKNNSVDVKDLPKGNYIIKTYSEKGTTTQKMIKN